MIECYKHTYTSHVCVCVCVSAAQIEHRSLGVDDKGKRKTHV